MAQSKLEARRAAAIGEVTDRFPAADKPAMLSPLEAAFEAGRREAFDEASDWAFNLGRAAGAMRNEIAAAAAFELQEIFDRLIAGGR
jgi:hypothetical protein